MKVYIVTEGGYSDYTIRAVFENKNAAEIWCALNTDNTGLVQEYDTQDHLISGDTTVYQLWKMLVPYDRKNAECLFFIRFTAKSSRKIIKSERGYVIQATTNREADRREAHKILLDILAQWKYENES